MNLPASDGVAHLELAAGVHTEPDDLIGQRVAHNLLRLRGKRNLSLDALARISGVSRAMLAQIESGRSVPSIKVLCKIAQGLKVSVAAFLDDRAFAGVAVLPAQQSKRLVSADGAFTSRALFPFDVARQVEFYELRLRGLGQEDAEAHAPGTQENLVVAQGVLEVRVNEERFLLATGDSILFYADQPHSYRNPADSPGVPGDDLPGAPGLTPALLPWTKKGPPGHPGRAFSIRRRISRCSTSSACRCNSSSSACRTPSSSPSACSSS